MNNLQEYKKWLQTNGYSDSTIKGYLYKIGVFIKEKNEFTEENIADFLFNLKEKKGRSAETINAYRNAISNFCNHFCNKDLQLPKYQKVEEKLPKYFSLKYLENEIIPMVEVLYRKEALKRKTILYFMFFTGIRISELITLKRKDIDLENRTAKIYMKKSNREKTIIFTKKVKHKLNQYFLISKEKQNAFNISEHGIRLMLKKISKYCDMNITPHTFRHCVSADTEILTKKGWKKYNEINIGDKVYTFNFKNKKGEWNKITNIYTEKIYNEKVYHLKSNKIDSIITKDHKIIYKNRLWKKNQKESNWLLNKASKVAYKDQIKILHAGKIKNKKDKIGVAKASILGLILTDGCIYIKKCGGKDITISQSLTANYKKCKIIEDNLKKANITFSKNISKEKINYFNNKKYKMVTFRILTSSHKFILDYINTNKIPKINKILALNYNELKAVFDSMMLGDGYKKEFKSPKYICDFFRILASLLGYRTVYSKKLNNTNKCKRVHFVNHNWSKLYKNHWKEIKYSGIVWCPTVKNKTWLAKRNNTIFFTGNSFSIHALRKGVDIVTVSKMLGHRDIKTTMRYLNVDIKAIKEKYDIFIE